MTDCDTLLMVGSSFPYSEFLPEEGQARGVQIDIDGRKLSLRYPMEVNLVGDSRATLRALLPLLAQDRTAAGASSIEQNVARVVAGARGARHERGRPGQPAARVLGALAAPARRLHPDLRLRHPAAWYARDLKMRRGMMGSLSGGLATMGPAVPYAIAAKMALPRPPRRSRCVGDGAMQMIGINGLITIAHRWQRLARPAARSSMVLNNGDLNMVTWEQRAIGRRRRSSRTRRCCPTSRMPEFAELLGLRRHARRPPRGGRPAPGTRRLRADRPMLLEMVTDPNVPPLPPHVTLKQARHYAKALLHGDPQAREVVMGSFKEVWDSLTKGKAG